MSRITLEPTLSVKTEKSVHTIRWRIPDFCKRCPQNAKVFDPIVSPIVHVGERNGKKLKWKFSIEEAEDKICCYLHLLKSNWDGDEGSDNIVYSGHAVIFEDEPDELKFVKCSYKIGFGNSKKNFVIRECASEKFSENTIAWGYQMTTISNLYNKGKDLLEDEALYVTIEMNIFLVNSTAPLDPLPNWLVNSSKDESTADLEIKCGGRIFNCHKLILSGRSSVFSRMFSSEWVEGVKGQLEIEDMEPTAVETLIKFIYTGEIELPDFCDWSDLVYGADKYDLEDMKDLCFQKMFQEATMDNFGKIFVTAYTYNAGSEFKEALKSYYKKHMTELMNNSEFVDIFSENSGTFNQV